MGVQPAQVDACAVTMHTLRWMNFQDTINDLVPVSMQQSMM